MQLLGKEWGGSRAQIIARETRCALTDNSFPIVHFLSILTNRRVANAVLGYDWDVHLY